jgi:hypothetical protein
LNVSAPFFVVVDCALAPSGSPVTMITIEEYQTWAGTSPTLLGHYFLFFGFAARASTCALNFAIDLSRTFCKRLASSSPILYLGFSTIKASCRFRLRKVITIHLNQLLLTIPLTTFSSRARILVVPMTRPSSLGLSQVALFI